MKREAAQGAQGCECENDLRGKVGCEKIITSGSDKGEVKGGKQDGHKKQLET